MTINIYCCHEDYNIAVRSEWDLLINPKSFDPFNLKRSIGFGTRIFLPVLGLVDLSYGYRLDGVLGETPSSTLLPGKWEFLFNIGTPF